MRLIGHLPEETAARTFGDFLYVQGIENQVDREKESGWAVWIMDEDKIPQASELLDSFRRNPGDQRYRARAKDAAELKAEKERDELAYQKKLRSGRQLFRPLTSYSFGPLTFALIAVSIWVFVMSKYGNSIEPISRLFITSVDPATYQWDHTLPEVRSGEIWRLFSPIFIHYTVLHILCNMLWLRDLGSMIESRQSTLHLLILVAVVAGLSNLGQLYVGGSPMFGGMSGVVYGLLGYVWLRGKFDPGSGLYLHSSTVSLMIIWFFACLIGIIPNVANMAHAVGLVTGMLWGYLSSLRAR